MQDIRTTVAQMELSGGMSYVVQLENGKFILIDGGEHFEVDGERLYRYLCEKSQGEKPVIACWFFTHGHKDHLKLAAEFMYAYKNDVVIENIAYNVPRDIVFNGYDKDKGEEVNEVAWYEAIENFPSAKRCVLKTGETFTFANARVDILATAFDPYPSQPTNRNQVSAVIKITFENGKSFMLLGDAMDERLVALVDPSSSIYCTDDVLKSDIMQTAHHGLKVCSEKDYASVAELYRKIAPSICIWPQKASRFYNDSWCQSEKYPYHRFLWDTVKERNFHQSQTIVVYIDDLSVELWKDNK